MSPKMDKVDLGISLQALRLPDIRGSMCDNTIQEFTKTIAHPQGLLIL